MPVGGAGSKGRKKFTHKGLNRHFNNEDEILRQQDEIKKQKEAEADESSEDEEGTGASSTAKTADAKKKAGSDSDSDSSDDSDDGKPVKGVARLVGDVSNPNRIKQKNKKLKDLDFDTPTPAAAAGAAAAPQALNRKEREVLEAERKKAEYQKRHARGETEEAMSDMARLAIIRKQREEAAKKREEDKKVKEAPKK